MHVELVILLKLPLTTSTIMKKYLTCLLLTLGMTSAYSQNNLNKQLTADEILLKSAKTYAGLKNYLDSGKVVNEHYNNDHPFKSAKHFRTAYSESLGFNFEYFEPNKSNSLYTINKSAGQVKTWWGINNKVNSVESLSSAVAAAAGVSSLTSVIVPKLLFPEEVKAPNFFTGITGELVQSETLNGQICHVISGVNKNGDKVMIWINRNDFLLRKVVIDKEVKASAMTADSVMNKRIEQMKSQADAEKDAEKKASLLAAVSQYETASKALRERLSKGPRKNFSVKSTYYYYPYHPKVINKQLYTFRPNREVAL